MTNSQRRMTFLLPFGIGASIAMISFVHFQAVDAHPLIHEITQRLYYLPIVFAAYRYGLKGGILFGVLSIVLFVPHLDLHSHEPEVYHNQTAEMIMFLLIGGVAGLLSDARKREHRRYEQTVSQLLVSDRLASLGQLSAGLVHEIRNPLASIKGAAEALETEIPKGNRGREFLDAIGSEVNRLNKLITEFLTYARPRSPELLLIQPNAVLRSVASLVAREAERLRLSVKVIGGEAVPPVLMDGEQIKQALLNLVINAMQATPAGGKIVLATSTSNGVATLAVSDSGAGISDAIKERLFTPFATTKEGGTGLGLAIAMKLVKQHGGTIAAANGPNGGAVFEIHLPVIDGLETRQVTVGATSNVAVGGLHG